MGNVSMVDGHIDRTTDEEIVQRLENKIKLLCDTCDIKYADCENTCVFGLALKSLDIISRQQSAIDVYLEENDRLKTAFVQVVMDREEAKAEAIKEFAKMLRKEKFTHKNFGEFVFVSDINKLERKMIGKKK